MPKIKACPYCRAGIGYWQLLTFKGKQHQCRKCKKNYAIQKGMMALPVLLACVLMIPVNLMVLYSSQDIQKSAFIGMIAADAAVIFLSFAAAPLFIRIQKLSRSRR